MMGTVLTRLSVVADVIIITKLIVYVWGKLEKKREIPIVHLMQDRRSMDVDVEHVDGIAIDGKFVHVPKFVHFTVDAVHSDDWRVFRRFELVYDIDYMNVLEILLALHGKEIFDFTIIYNGEVMRFEAYRGDDLDISDDTVRVCIVEKDRKYIDDVRNNIFTMKLVEKIERGELGNERTESYIN